MRHVTTSGFEAVRAIGAALPDVEVTSAWGAPALKVQGKMFVCMATHRSAEPNTLVVRMDIDEDPVTYYLKDHYLGYPCVLVRLSRVHADALRDLVLTAYRCVNATTRRRQPSRLSATKAKT
jgi:hypothetical protein